jgi:hypothetical protein
MIDRSLLLHSQISFYVVAAAVFLLLWCIFPSSSVKSSVCPVVVVPFSGVFLSYSGVHCGLCTMQGALQH